MRVKLFDSLNKAKDTLNNNQPRRVRVDKKEICIVRNDNKIYAFQNACTHMGEQLHKGNTNFLDEIICPLHSYRFSMKTGDESNHRCKPLHIYPLEEDATGLYLII
ncbi:MAG: Rieske (2Fe-2S) protein [Ekhidna sp.]|nr:Rieske (2Fe-2S) protein [Ekhidna sp.]